MKAKNLLMTTIAIFGLALISNAQVPNYVPSNGLVGWWPFNGNANDESLNGNDGIVSGPSITSDRFGNLGASFSFNGSADYINTELSPRISISSNSDISISYWCSFNSLNIDHPLEPIFLIDSLYSKGITSYYDQTINKITASNSILGTGYNSVVALSNTESNIWYNVIITVNIPTNLIKLYINGIFQSSSNISSLVISDFKYLHIGRHGIYPNLWHMNGKIDDIGLWNRALTQEEITALFNAPNCSNDLTISPASNQLHTGNTATFSSTTSDPNPSYVWQSDFGQGFQTLNDYGNYTGVNTNSLSISNVQLPNHTQPIRVISTSGECIDTSNVATISITDTCILTINDTITTLISVTDTLVINTLITGLTPPNNLNTIKVFPNPANNHITIDFGNFASMNGYTLKITNSIGQTVFTTPINQQSSYIDL
jgi:hypothetical protein